MNPKKTIQAIIDPNVSLQERMFRLLTMIGLCGLLGGILVGMIAGEKKINLLPLITAFIAFFVFLWDGNGGICARIWTRRLWRGCGCCARLW